MQNSTKRSLTIASAFVVMAAGGLSLPNLSPVSAPEMVMMAGPVPSDADQNGTLFYQYCGTDAPHSYFDGSNKESPKSFGPASSIVVKTVVWDDFYARMCGVASEDYANEGGVEGGDPALFRGVDAAVHPELDPNRDLSIAAWQNQATAFMQEIDMQSIDLVRDTSAVGTYSLSMESESGTGRIVIKAVQVKPRTSWYLKFDVLTDNGRRVPVKLRIECGFQPDLGADQLPPTLK